MEKKNSFLALKFSMRRRMFSALQLCASSIGLPKSEEASGFAPFAIVQDRRITEGGLGTNGRGTFSRRNFTISTSLPRIP